MDAGLGAWWLWRLGIWGETDRKQGDRSRNRDGNRKQEQEQKQSSSRRGGQGGLGMWHEGSVNW